MPRKSNKDARRAEIVAAALPVLARAGYEKATVQAIAQQAGLAPGLIHYHFKNKLEILVSLVSAIGAYARQRFDEAVDAATSPTARLHAYLDARLGLGEGAAPDMVAAWVVIGAEAVRQPEVRAVYQQAVAAELQVLHALIEACLVDTGRDTASAPRLAAALLAMMEGAYQLSSAAGEVMPAGYAAEAAINFAAWHIAAAPPLP